MLQLTFKRYEYKYLLTAEQRRRLEMRMRDYMVADEWGASTVCNVYYDTDSHILIRRSAEHPDYKEKVRIRSYGVRREGDPVFVELKKKYDGVVYKRRCTMDAERAEAMLSGNGDPRDQIERELDFTCRRYGGLVPSFYIAYDREAYYAKDDHDFRMTFDQRIRSRTTDMDLTSSDEGELLLPDGFTLLEVKAAGAIPMWLVDFFCQERIYRVTFSKVGRAYEREFKRALEVKLPATQPVRAANRHPKHMRVPALSNA